MKNEIEEVLEVKAKAKGKLGSLKKRELYIPTYDDPREELRHLVKQHKSLTRSSVAITSMCSDREFEQDDGSVEVVKSNVPADAREAMVEVSEVLKKKAGHLESKMLRTLKKIPIYTHFLEGVFGVGAVTSAYLVSEVDIHKATKISNLRRYCGLAVMNGALERPTKGQKLGYNKELRTRLFQAFSSMWKLRDGRTSKYLTIWSDYIHRMHHSDRVTDAKVDAKGKWSGKIVKDGGDKQVSAAGFVFSTGWHKAADEVIEDLYIVWRALEGLPVWPSYHAAKLGYSHGGKICVNAPKILTLEEAKALVGFVGIVNAEAAE